MTALARHDDEDAEIQRFEQRYEQLRRDIQARYAPDPKVAEFYLNIADGMYQYRKRQRGAAYREHMRRLSKRISKSYEEARANNPLIQELEDELLALPAVQACMRAPCYTDHPAK